MLCFQPIVARFVPCTYHLSESDIMMSGLIKSGLSEQPVFQRIVRFIERVASFPVLALLVLLSILFPAVLFPLHGLEDIKPLDLYFSYSPDQVYTYLATLGAQGRENYTRMLLTSDMAFPVIYSLALSTALLLVLRKLLPLGSAWLCLFPFLIVIADWLENLSLVMIMRKFPEQSDKIVAFASAFTSMKWVLVILTGSILLAAMACWVAGCSRSR